MDAPGKGHGDGVDAARAEARRVTRCHRQSWEITERRGLSSTDRTSVIDRVTAVDGLLAPVSRRCRRATANASLRQEPRQRALETAARLVS